MLSKYIKQSTTAALVACSLGFAVEAGAAVVLTTADTFYLGNINDGIPSNPADEVVYINTLIAQPLNSGPTQIPALTGEFYTRSGNNCGGPCPTALLAGATKDDTNPSTTIDLGVLGWDYVLGKYDADQAGSYVWYVGGLTGEVTIPGALGNCGANGCGLSHWSLYNASERPPQEIPEPASLALLGLGLAGLGLMRRRKHQ